MRRIFCVFFLAGFFCGETGNLCYPARSASRGQKTSGQDYVKVRVKRKPTDKDWTLRDTRTIESLEDMKKLNRDVYALIDYFDSK